MHLVKKLVIGIMGLLAATISGAADSPNKNASVYAAFSAICSEVGYLFGVATPYFLNNGHNALFF